MRRHKSPQDFIKTVRRSSCPGSVSVAAIAASSAAFGPKTRMGIDLALDQFLHSPAIAFDLAIEQEKAHQETGLKYLYYFSGETRCTHT